MLQRELVCVIVSYNIGEEIYKCYDSIKKQVDKVIIVDNGSDAETIKVLKNIDKDKNCEVIFLKENYGIAYALNIGAKTAVKGGYKWIITMDNDSQASKDMVKVMMDVYNNLIKSEKDKVVSIAPRFISEGEKICKEEKNIYSYENLVITSGNIVNLDIFEEIGYFKEDYFIDYVDNEFCLRILESGKKIIQVNNAILKHKLGNSLEKKILCKTIKSTNHSPVRRYYLTRNSLDVQKRYKHLNIKHINNTKRVLLKFMLEILLVEGEKYKKLKYMWKGYRDYKKGVFGEFR